MSYIIGDPECGIQDVWAVNMMREFKKMRQIVKRYPFIAMVNTFKSTFKRV